MSSGGFSFMDRSAAEWPGEMLKEQLRAEREAMQRELDDARARIVQLERLADEDSLAPIANRRAFVREL